MNFLTQFFYKLNKVELQYYKDAGVDKKAIEFLPSAFVAAFQKGNLTDEQANEVIASLSYEQKKKLYDDLMSTMDPFSPDEKLMDLLDLLDPDETYFNSNTGGD
jgi:hypothetical protein